MSRAPDIGDDQSSAFHTMKRSCTVLHSFDTQPSIIHDLRGDIFRWCGVIRRAFHYFF